MSYFMSYFGECIHRILAHDADPQVIHREGIIHSMFTFICCHRSGYMGLEFSGLHDLLRWDSKKHPAHTRLESIPANVHGSVLQELAGVGNGNVVCSGMTLCNN